MAANKTTKYAYKATERYDYDIRPGETDLQYYRRLAKTADQRLVRLEALKHDPYFRGVEKYAYARAMRDIETFGGTNRFNTKPPEARSLFNEKIADMLRFLQSPTSTKKGIVEVYQTRVNTINQKYGMNLSWQQFAQIAESGAMDKLFGDYGSDTVFKAIGTVQRNKKQIEKMAEDVKDQEEKGEKQLVEMYNIATDSPLDRSVEAVLRNEELKEILLK